MHVYMREIDIARYIYRERETERETRRIIQPNKSRECDQ